MNCPLLHAGVHLAAYMIRASVGRITMPVIDAMSNAQNIPHDANYFQAEIKTLAGVLLKGRAVQWKCCGGTWGVRRRATGPSGMSSGQLLQL